MKYPTFLSMTLLFVNTFSLVSYASEQKTLLIPVISGYSQGIPGIAEPVACSSPDWGISQCQRIGFSNVTTNLQILEAEFQKVREEIQYNRADIIIKFNTEFKNKIKQELREEIRQELKDELKSEILNEIDLKR